MGNSDAYNYVLGIQCFATDDSGACLLRFSEDGETLDYVAIEEGRLIRNKYPYTFPLHSIEYCMDNYGLDSLNEIDLIVSDWIRKKRWHRSGPAYNTKEFDYLKMVMDYPIENIHQIGHHLAHAASVYYASPFEESAILIADGNGSDVETQSFFEASGTNIEKITTTKRHGIGALYTAVTNWILDLGPGGEGKTMGLAPYGQKYDSILDINGEYDGPKTDYSNFMRRLPRSDVLNQDDSDNKIDPIYDDYRRRDGEDVTQPYFASVAHDVQQEAENAMVHLADELYKITGSKNLCMAGGTVLNSVANRRVFDDSEFEDMYVFPACSDAGIPFGLCTWAYYNHPKFEEFTKVGLNFPTPYTGKPYDDSEITSLLGKYNIYYTKTSTKEVAQILSDGYVVGWFQDEIEYGPRALGHRSILADSRDEKMRDFVNEKVKDREKYRPFAPSVLLEDCNEYFDIDYESPYMLQVVNVKKPDEIPAVTHVDDTARVQTVTKETNRKYHELITEFNNITGVPVILNTSFNQSGEAIVESPLDALICFIRTDMRYLVLGDNLIDSQNIDDQLLDDLVAARKKHIREKYHKIIDKHFSSYDADERDNYIEFENEKARWHATKRPQYELEKQVNQWIEEGTKVLIVGTLDHTSALMDHINRIWEVDIIGFTPFKNKYEDPTMQENIDLDLSKIAWEDIERCDYDVALISSWEHMFKIEEKLQTQNVHTYSPYDNSSRSILDTLSDLPTFEPS